MRLDIYIESSGIRVGAFAKEIGVSRSLIHKYIKGERHPSAETMKEIVRATNGQVMPNDFFDLPS